MLKKIFLLITVSSVLVTTACKNEELSFKRQEPVLIPEQQAPTKNIGAIPSPNIGMFENANNNQQIKFNKKQKQNLDILRNVNGDIQINQKFLRNSIWFKWESTAVTIEKLGRLQAIQEHLLRVSNESTLEYEKFSKQFLSANSPKTYKNNLSLVSEFKKSHLFKNTNLNLDLEKILLKTKEHSAYIVTMYNYLSHFYGKQNIETWLYELSIKDSTPGDELTLTNMYESFASQNMILNTKSLDTELTKTLYEEGEIGVKSITYNFIREYGNVLQNSLKYGPNQLNKEFLGSPLEISPTPQEQGYSMVYKRRKHILVVEEFIRFIASKLGYKDGEIAFTMKKEDLNSYDEANFNTATQNNVTIARLFSNSIYGRTNNLKKLFPDIFAQWLLEPLVNSTTKNSIRWVILNEFFLNHLPFLYARANTGIF